MDALHILHTAQQHHHVFPELQSHWHELTLGVSPWDYLTHISLLLHPCQILFVPEAFCKLHKITKLEIISECAPIIARCSPPVSCLHQLHPVKLLALASDRALCPELRCAHFGYLIPDD